LTSSLYTLEPSPRSTIIFEILPRPFRHASAARR
jgi:hypothetical protein